MRELSAAMLLGLLLLATPSAAAEPKIDGLAATAAAGKISVRFSLRDAFADEQTMKALLSGLPTSFRYTIDIYRNRPNWFDDGIARCRIEVIATFNSVTREFLLNYRRDKLLVRSETFTDVALLEKRMTSIVEPNLFESGRWRPNKLKVRVRADLSRSFVMYVIPWETSTRWREVRVTTEKP